MHFVNISPYLQGYNSYRRFEGPFEEKKGCALKDLTSLRCCTSCSDIVQIVLTKAIREKRISFAPVPFLTVYFLVDKKNTPKAHVNNSSKSTYNYSLGTLPFEIFDSHMVYVLIRPFYF